MCECECVCSAGEQKYSELFWMEIVESVFHNMPVAAIVHERPPPRDYRLSGCFSAVGSVSGSAAGSLRASSAAGSATPLPLSRVPSADGRSRSASLLERRASKVGRVSSKAGGSAASSSSSMAAAEKDGPNATADLGWAAFCCHGGISPELTSLEGLERLRDLKRPCGLFDGGPEPVPWDLVWSDPEEKIEGFKENEARNTSYFFGRSALEKFLSECKLDLLIRGHQVCI